MNRQQYKADGLARPYMSFNPEPEGDGRGAFGRSQKEPSPSGSELNEDTSNRRQL